MTKMTTAKFRQIAALLRDTLSDPEVAAQFAKLGVVFDSNGNGSLGEASLKLPVTFKLVGDDGETAYTPSFDLIQKLARISGYREKQVADIMMRGDNLLSSASGDRVYANLNTRPRMDKVMGTLVIHKGEATTEGQIYKFDGRGYVLYVNAASEIGRTLHKTAKTGIIRFGDAGEYEYTPATGLKIKGDTVSSDFGPDYDCDVEYLWLPVPKE